jgi:mRNA interferase MazF
MTLESGEIVLVPFPYSNQQSAKQRPALVLSSSDFNSGPDAVLCAITSNLQNSDRSILINQSDMAKGNLLLPSRIKPGKLVSVEQSVIRKSVGRVSATVMHQVWKELDSLLGR